MAAVGGVDRQRSRVYAAEAFIRTLFDRCRSRGNPSVEFFGTALTLPPEARFGSVESVSRYVDQVLTLPLVRERWPNAGPVRVRSRRGATAAHYERTGDTAVIAVPAARSTWALRELVVLHELAHHLAPPGPAHGPQFTATHCALTAAVMGPEVGHVMRVVYAQEGVR